MALISLAEYAKKNGRSARQIRRKAARGGYKTAVKMGRDWLINENEKNVDLRVKSGKYKKRRMR